MGRTLLNWLLTAVLLLVVAHVVNGFHVNGFLSALIAAVVVGCVNATLGNLLKIITLPITLFTFGIFLLVINALMLKLTARLVPGFEIVGFAPAFWGGLLLAMLQMLVRWLMPKREEHD